ncbi:P2Y purinoceptor 8-like [Ambystoma mexicanum]|uniref:P2Y purinoceptor 8-like n=1 Tax=Ambystoma mexicanum TaxID=8296 RepID=UPI0037E99F7F
MPNGSTLGSDESRLPTTVPRSLSNSTLEMLRNEKLQTVVPIIYLFIFIVSIFLNSISMWILCANARPKTPTIIFAINLVINDLLYTVTLPFQVVYHMSGNNWPFGSVFCSIVTVLFYGNMHCSIWTMMSISVERYLKIVHPLRSKSLTTNTTALVTCLSIWAFVLMIDSPYMYTNLTFHVQELKIFTCFDVLPKDMFPSRTHFYVYFGSSAALTFFLPMTVMAICYISIITRLLRSPPRQLKETKLQIICLIVALLTVFLGCFLPSNILTILHLIYSRQNRTLYVEYKFSLAFSGLNCCLDPFVYYFGSKEFRKNVEKTLFFCTMTNVLDDNNTSNMSEHSIPLT